MGGFAAEKEYMSDLAGKSAIVTGGGRGIGRGIAMALARAGARVALFGRTESSLRSVQDEIAAFGGTALPVVGDVSARDDRERLIKETLDHFGRLDILVNNAALMPRNDLLTFKESQIEGAWQAGPYASLMLMRLSHPHLKGGGCVINISSAQAITGNLPRYGIYAATKAALNAISRTAAIEWGPDGIRVNIIMPFGESDAVKSFFEQESETAKAVLASVPLGRVGDPERDIGRVAVFLASDEAGYITGVTLPVDGGTAYIR
jgi:meso-butanediol dehydrogenase/(S,S)-butanediol dehydrogenase/diacetyl reductase